MGGADKQVLLTAMPKQGIHRRVTGRLPGRSLCTTHHTTAASVVMGGKPRRHPERPAAIRPGPRRERTQRSLRGCKAHRKNTLEMGHPIKRAVTPLLIGTSTRRWPNPLDLRVTPMVAVPRFAWTSRDYCLGEARAGIGDQSRGSHEIMLVFASLPLNPSPRPKH